VPAAARTVHSDLLRVLLLSLVWLFAIPAATLAFTQYALRSEDARFLASVEEQLAKDGSRSAEDRAAVAGYYRNHPLSKACSAAAPEDRDYHDRVCPRYGVQWQFHWAERVASWTLAYGVALLAAALALGALAFTNRALRYASFVAGWRLMTLSSAAEVLLQGAMLVWLSFWVTAFFWERYFVKLVVIAGVLAGGAALLAIRSMFKRLGAPFEIDGELVAAADAPRLWERVRELAARLPTAPPDHIVAGIDTNFFVTEAPCVVGGRTLTGRTLFVSIPLLRVLETAEADAVLAHELAHLGGGDTRSSAALGPKLQQFDQYTWSMRSGGLTVVAYHLLRLYRMIFEFALARDSRERETAADRTAARLTAPSAIADSLVKISAYSSYRASVERELFAHEREHVGQLGIAGFVAAGLFPYAASPEFVSAMQTANVPHPYDHHPPLPERMRNVGHVVPEAAWGAVVARTPQATWADEIVTAPAIEQRLWGDYERRFAQSHELSLAYRYEPATDEQRAVVLRHFPPLEFALRKGETIELSVLGLAASAAKATVAWDDVKALTFQGGGFTAVLVVTHHDKGLIGARKTTLKLRGMGEQVEAFRHAVGRYWHRHQIMRAGQRARAAP
jgi:Zn-dependent protease with chaperone function